MADSVESNRLVLLRKGETAYHTSDDAKTLRILRRLAAQTAPNAPVIPIVPAKDPGQVGPLPLLSETLAASAATANKPHLPSETEPPLFIIYYNTGITHLREGRISISRIFLTRALEESQTLTSMMAPTGVGTTIAASPRTIGRSTLSVPSSSLQSSPTSSSSRLTISTQNGANAAATSSSSSSAAYNFLRTKQRAVFYATGIALQMAHSQAAYSADATESQEGLRLAYRCFAHCAAITAFEGAPSAIDSVSSIRDRATLYIRMAEVLIECNRLQELDRTPTHPLVDPPSDRNVDRATSQLISTGDPDSTLTGSLDEFSLGHAVTHLQRALVVLEGATTAASATAADGPSDTPASDSSHPSSMKTHAHLLLVHTLIALSRFDEATASTAAIESSSLDPPTRTRLDLYVLEARIGSGQLEDAWKHIDRLITTADSLPESASLTEPQARHILISRIYIAIHRQQFEQARNMLEKGLRLLPADRTLLRLHLFLHARTGASEEIPWIIKQHQTVQSTPTTLLKE